MNANVLSVTFLLIGCKTEPCNECIHCLDMPKNGGKGTMKKTCIHRSCENINYQKGSMNNIGTARAILEKFRQGTQTPSSKTKSQTSDKKSKKNSTAAKNPKIFPLLTRSLRRLQPKKRNFRPQAKRMPV